MDKCEGCDKGLLLDVHGMHWTKDGEPYDWCAMEAAGYTWYPPMKRMPRKLKKKLKKCGLLASPVPRTDDPRGVWVKE